MADTSVLQPLTNGNTTSILQDNELDASADLKDILDLKGQSKTVMAEDPVAKATDITVQTLNPIVPHIISSSEETDAPSKEDASLVGDNIAQVVHTTDVAASVATEEDHPTAVAGEQVLVANQETIAEPKDSAIPEDPTIPVQKEDNCAPIMKPVEPADLDTPNTSSSVIDVTLTTTSEPANIASTEQPPVAPVPESAHEVADHGNSLEPVLTTKSAAVPETVTEATSTAKTHSEAASAQPALDAITAVTETIPTETPAIEVATTNSAAEPPTEAVPAEAAELGTSALATNEVVPSVGEAEARPDASTSAETIPVATDAVVVLDGPAKTSEPEVISKPQIEAPKAQENANAAEPSIEAPSTEVALVEATITQTEVEAPISESTTSADEVPAPEQYTEQHKEHSISNTISEVNKVVETIVEQPTPAEEATALPEPIEPSQAEISSPAQDESVPTATATAPEVSTGEEKPTEVEPFSIVAPITEHDAETVTPEPTPAHAEVEESATAEEHAPATVEAESAVDEPVAEAAVEAAVEPEVESAETEPAASEEVTKEIATEPIVEATAIVEDKHEVQPFVEETVIQKDVVEEVVEPVEETVSEPTVEVADSKPETVVKEPVSAAVDTVSESVIEVPATIVPAASEPVVEEATTVVSKHIAEDAATVVPVVSEPVIEDTTTGVHATSEPFVEEPSTAVHAASEPVVDAPVTTITTVSTASKPVAEEPEITTPTPIVEEPVTTVIEDHTPEPVVEEHISEQLANKPVTVEVEAAQPVASKDEESIAEPAAAEEAINEPVEEDAAPPEQVAPAASNEAPVDEVVVEADSNELVQPIALEVTPDVTTPSPTEPLVATPAVAETASEEYPTKTTKDVTQGAVDEQPITTSEDATQNTQVETPTGGEKGPEPTAAEQEAVVGVSTTTTSSSDTIPAEVTQATDIATQEAQPHVVREETVPTELVAADSATEEPPVVTENARTPVTTSSVEHTEAVETSSVPEPVSNVEEAVVDATASVPILEATTNAPVIDEATIIVEDALAVEDLQQPVTPPTEEIVPATSDDLTARKEAPASDANLVEETIEQPVPVPVIHQDATLAADHTAEPQVSDKQIKVETTILAVEGDIERPKSPWASFQVTTVGHSLPEESPLVPDEVATEAKEASNSFEHPPSSALRTIDERAINQATIPELHIDNSLLDIPADTEKNSEAPVEEPARPWTPSYSVHSQGSPRQPHVELEAEPQEPPTRPWTPSYSVHSQGSPLPIQAALEEEPLADDAAIETQDEEAVELEEMKFADNEDAPALAPSVPPAEEQNQEPSDALLEQTITSVAIAAKEEAEPAAEHNEPEVNPKSMDVHKASVETIEEQSDVAAAQVSGTQVPELVLDTNHEQVLPSTQEEQIPGGLIPSTGETPVPPSWIPSYSVSVQGSPAQERSNPLDDNAVAVETKAAEVEDEDIASAPAEDIEAPVSELANAAEAKSTEPEVIHVTPSSFQAAVVEAATESTEGTEPSEVLSIVPSLVADEVKNVLNVDTSLPADKEEPPKSPWTPSYSVTTQGTALESDETGLNTLEPLPSKNSQTIPGSVPEEIVPTVTVEATAAVVDSPGEAFPTIPVTVEEPKQSKSSGLRLSTLDENAVSGDALASQPETASPVTGRSRLESTASSRFFPGGWFSPSKTVDEGRASLEVAQGEFTAAKIAVATNPSIDEGPVAEQSDEDAVNMEPQSASSEEKRRWCVIM